MIKLVIFDLDGVLYQYDKAWRLQKFAERSGRSPEEVRRLWQESGWEDEAERGRFRTGAEYLAAFNDLLGTDFTLDEWVDIRRHAMVPERDVLAIAAQVKAHARIAVLTNNAQLLREQIGRIAPELLSLFGDSIHTSADFGARKPEPALFEAVMAHHGMSAADTAFIDDSEKNVSEAAAFGITAHHFRSTEGLRKFVGGLWVNTDDAGIGLR